MRTSIRWMQALAFTLALLATAEIAFGDLYDVTIQGRITDKMTMVGIPSAEVQITNYDGRFTVVTDAQGFYSVTVTTHSYAYIIVRAGARGHSPGSYQGHFPSAGLYHVDIALYPSATVPTLDVRGEGVFTVSSLPFSGTLIVWVDDEDQFDWAPRPTMSCSATGPGQAVFNADHHYYYWNIQYTVTEFGVYDFTFTHTDVWGDKGSASVRVTVQGLTGVQCPVVEAGDPIITTATRMPGWSVRLEGTAYDPDNGPDASARPCWSQKSGPGNAVFDDPERCDTSVSFDRYGVYELTLAYDDGTCAVGDTVMVTVNEPTPPGATVVQGTVTDDRTGVAIQDARVRISNPGIGIGDETLTNGAGFYSFTGIELGACDTLSVTASGYVELTRTISVVPASVNTIDFALIPVAAEAACEPLVYMSLDETSGTIAHDLSGHGNNGTLKGNPQWVAGYDGGGLRFDGKDDYVDTQFTQNLAKWTICCWVSSPATPANGSASGPIHREQNLQINWNHTDPKFRSAAALSVGGTWYAASFGTLGANTWYHLAATYDGASLKVYRDGELITTTSCPGTPAAESNSLKLAKHASSAQFFSGTVDDVYVYPCALSQDEIMGLMSKGVVSILEVIDNGTIANQEACYASVWSDAGTTVKYTSDVLDIHDSGPRGHFGRNKPFGVVARGHRTPGSVDNLSMRADGVVRIPAGQGGHWTFGVNSDDGFTLVFPGRNFSSVVNGELPHLTDGTAIRFAGGRALADTLGVINLPAGDHPFWLTYHEGAGQAGVELFAAKGVHAAFDPDLFRLVGQKDIGTLAIPGFCDEVSMLATKPGENGAIDSLAKARAALTASERTIRTVKCQFVNHIDPDTLGVSSGTFGGQMPFPNDVLSKDDNEFAVKVTGLLDIPADGVYQIGFNSDDGASLKITGKTWQSIVADGTGKAVLAGDELVNDAISGNTFTAGQITLTKGCHAFEAVMFEHDGGSYFELFGRGVSDRGIPDPTWRLLLTGGAQYPVDITGLPLVKPVGMP